MPAATAARDADRVHADFIKSPDRRQRFAESEMGIAVTRALVRFRVARGISREELGERVGRSASYIERLEAGGYARCPLPALRTFARALGYDIEVDVLLSMFEGMPSPAFACEVGVEPTLDADLRREIIVVGDASWKIDPGEAAAAVTPSHDRALEIGDLATALVAAMNREAFLVEIRNTTAVLPFAELSSDPKTVEIGSRIVVAVHRVQMSDGTLYVSERRARTAESWNALIDAGRNGDVVWGTLRDVVKRGLIADVNGVHGYVPASEVGGSLQEVFATYFDRPVPLKVLAANRAADRVVLSLKRAHRAPRIGGAAKCREGRTASLRVVKSGTRSLLVNASAARATGGSGFAPLGKELHRW